MNRAALEDCLRRFCRHVDTERIALTGRVAINLHVTVAHGDRSRRVVANDVDVVADDAGAVRKTVTTDFLVSHFHRPQPGHPRFLIQLVDATTRLRLDIFPDTLRALSRAHVVDVSGVPLRVLDARAILDHKLGLLSSASPASPVEKKHYADAMRLGAICGRQVARIPSSHLAAAVYSHDVDATCARCDVSRSVDFPLAPKRVIFDILGYV